MTQQGGIIPLKGTVDRINVSRGRSAMPGEKEGSISNGNTGASSYKVTRANGAEFARAGRAVKLLRNAVSPLLQNMDDRWSGK